MTVKYFMDNQGIIFALGNDGILRRIAKAFDEGERVQMLADLIADANKGAAL